MMSFSKFMIESEGPQTHDELLAHYNDPESHGLIAKGIHPGTFDKIPPHLQPGYAMQAPGYAAPQNPNAVPTANPTGYRLQPEVPNAGQKDRFGRTVQPAHVMSGQQQAQDDMAAKKRSGVPLQTGKSTANTNPAQEFDRSGRRIGYGLAPTSPQ